MAATSVDAGYPGLHLLCVAGGEMQHRSTRGQQNKRIQWMEQKMSTFYLLNETVHFVFNTTDTVLKTEQLAGSC